MVTVLKGASKTNDGLELLDEVEFIFHRALKQFSGAIKRQHGTNGHGINALAKRHEIHRMVCKAYPGDHTCAAKVKDIMDWWLQLANNLFEICILLKSQSKMTPNRVKKLKYHIVWYGIRWRKQVTWKCPVYWKMYTMECCLMNFVIKHGVAGQVSTEGFENKHHVMANLKMMLLPMVKMVDQVNKLVQRQAIHLLPGLNEKIDKIQSKKVRTGHCRPYNASGRTRNSEEIRNILDEETSADKEVDGYFRTLSNFFLPNELQDVYNIYQQNMVPDEWQSAFDLSALLGNQAKKDSAYLV
jgi:hypothetical protein